MTRGRSTGEKEEERRKKIGEYRKSQAAPRPEVPDRSGGRSHSLEEIEEIERESGLVHDGWEVVGGEFLDRETIGRDRKTGETLFRAVRAHVGMKIEVPVFRRRRR